MLMLHKLMQEGECEILALISTVIEGESKIDMHEVPQALLEAQACALGFPLYTLALPRHPGNIVYEEKFGGMLERLKRRGVQGVAFGDIFLQDIRDYREGFLQRVGVQPLFPLWKADSHQLIRDFIDLGFKGITVCVDSRALDSSFAGRDVDEDFLQNLPAGVDPCGENGEFHCFVYDGPLFKDRVQFKKSKIHQRDKFYYCDLSAQ